MRKNRFIAWLLVVTIFLSMFSTNLTVSYADGTASSPEGYVTISVEKFTLGQGYYREPVKVPYYAGDNGADIFTRFLGEGNYQNSGSIDSAFYLSKIKDNDTSSLNVPPYILSMMSIDGVTVGSKNNEEWLGEFDYTGMSGWMYAVNNDFLDYGFSDYSPNNGDVIRTQFTVYGYGIDLGNKWGDVKLANKDALTAAIGQINSDSNKDIILSNAAVKTAYVQAYEALENIESPQAVVDQALTNLNYALANANDTEKPVLIIEDLHDKEQVSESDISFNVSVTDNVYKEVTPEVKLNGVVISGTNGEYKVTLNTGENNITVTAVDGAGNKAEKNFVILYKESSAILVKKQLDLNLAYIHKTVDNPTFGTGGGEWSVLSLARGNYPVSNSYYDTYYKNVVNKVKELMSKYNGKLDKTKGTEHSRLILGLSSIGKDIRNVADYDIRNALADFDFVTKQGINGPIFALIALDSHNYEIPLVEGVVKQTSRDELIRYILDREVKKGTENAGGWALGVTNADTDITAMAIQGLAPYYESNNEVKAAVDRAVSWLSRTQNIEGGFTSWGSTSSESIAQVVVALAGLEIDPHTDSRFIKNGKSLIDALLSFAVPEGGFKHTLTGKVDGMATDQGTYALIAYDRFINGKKRLYDMTDVQIVTPEPPIETPDPPTETPDPPGNGGGTNPQPKQYVTLSVDKKTINKGDVVATVSVELQPGDTAWSVLQRELNSRNISYEYVWTEKYGSVYVQSIAGDGEFDHGSGSGWMFNVNNWYPNYGASKYILKAGDRLQWRYTTNLGTDLNVPKDWEDSTSNGSVDPNDKKPVIDVPNDIQSDYVKNITKEMKDTDNITINIPDVKHKVILNLEDVADDIPMITATKGDISVIFEKGTKLKTNNPNIELITSIDPKDSKLQESIQASLGSKDKLDKINHAFIMGNTTSSVLFDKPLSIIVKGGKGQLPGFIEGNKFTPLIIYESEELAIEATKGNEKIAYAFVKGNDLIIKTNHFTTYVSYTVSPKETETTFDLKKVYSDTDLISAWAYKEVSEATKKTFIQGNGGKFNPKSTITKAEFIKILVSVLGLPTQSSNASSFTDVAKEDWFYPYVNAAHQAGLITGFNNKFNPNDNITREQMAVTIARALGIEPAKLTTPMKDSKAVSAWAKADVETIVAVQLMEGSGNQFKPKAVVTREMAVVVAMRAYDYKNGTGKDDNQTGQVENAAVKNLIKNTAAFMQKSVTDPVIASVGGEWTVFGLARSEVKVPDEYYAKYYANVEKTLKEKSGKLHNVKYTEYDRVILALTSIGKKVDNVAGYNLLKPLADFNMVIKQGINGPIFALIALDSNHYEIPIDEGVTTQTTRQMLVDFILKREIVGGGWALGEKAAEPDPDITGMVIQGLSPYYQTDKNVKAAVDRGVEWLSKAQKSDGGYSSGGSINSESIAQVIVALTSLGIDPDRDARFIKNGNSVVDALLGFAVPSGGFYHIKSGGTDNGGAKPGEVDLMATDQAMYALVAYDRSINKHNRLYDMTDVK